MNFLSHLNEQKYDSVKILSGISLLLTVCSTVYLCPTNCRCYGTPRLGINCNCSWATLQTIPQEGVDSNTTKLIASHNKLTSLKNISFRAFHQQPLAVITLDYNSISEVDSSAFNGLVFLKQLSMSHNMIIRLPPVTFADAIQLQQIQISDNNLTHVHPELLMKNRYLQLFDVGNNRIKTLPSDLFKYNNNLLEVHVNGNELRFLSSQQFQHNPKLRVVHLENNKIMHLHADMFTYSRLPLYVNLNNNEIHQIRGNIFQKNCHIKTVDVSKNKVANISVCQLLCFKGAMNIDISGNPLVCGSDVEQVVELCHNYSICNEGECNSGTPRNSNTALTGRRLYRNVLGMKTISENKSSFPLSTTTVTSNYNDTSADFPTAEGTAKLPQEMKQKVLTNDISVVSGNESATMAFVNEYKTVSTSPPEYTEQNLTTEVTLVEYDSPTVLRESTMRGILFIGLECLLASVFFLRKLLCPSDINDSAVVDTIELLSKSGPKSEGGSSEIENSDV